VVEPYVLVHFIYQFSEAFCHTPDAVKTMQAAAPGMAVTIEKMAVIFIPSKTPFPVYYPS